MHARDNPDLCRAIYSTTLRPQAYTAADLVHGLEVVADVEGLVQGWWAGCVYRKRRRYPFHAQSDLMLLVLTDEPKGRNWRTEALVGRLPEWAQEER